MNNNDNNKYTLYETLKEQMNRVRKILLQKLCEYYLWGWG